MPEEEVSPAMEVETKAGGIGVSCSPALKQIS
jgi:hypothetical protein